MTRQKNCSYGMNAMFPDGIKHYDQPRRRNSITKPSSCLLLGEGTNHLLDSWWYSSAGQPMTFHTTGGRIYYSPISIPRPARKKTSPWVDGANRKPPIPSGREIKLMPNKLFLRSLAALSAAAGLISSATADTVSASFPQASGFPFLPMPGGHHQSRCSAHQRGEARFTQMEYPRL